MAECEGCGNLEAHRLKWIYTKTERRQTCDECGGMSTFFYPDVFFDGPGYVEHLVDEKNPSTWFKGSYISSRNHKAIVMRELGVVETGDAVHGARNFTKRRMYIT